MGKILYKYIKILNFFKIIVIVKVDSKINL